MSAEEVVVQATRCPDVVLLALPPGTAQPLLVRYPESAPGLAVIDLREPLHPWDQVRVDLVTGAAWSTGLLDWSTVEQVNLILDTIAHAFPGIGEMPTWAVHLCDVMSLWAEQRETPIKDSWLPAEEVSA